MLALQLFCSIKFSNLLDFYIERENNYMKSNNVSYYDNLLLMSSSRRSYYKEKLDFFTSRLGNKGSSKKQKILDIGCNDGELTELYDQFGHAVGIDINRNAIKECKKRGLECFCMDLNDMVKTHANSFDFVIAGDIIEHIFETDKFLHNIHTVLKRNGKVLLTTPNLVSFGRRIMMMMGVNPYIEFSTELPSKEFNVGHIRYYTEKNLRAQLAAQGFRNVIIEGDIINILPHITIPHRFAKNMSKLARNFLVYAEKG